MEEHERIVTLLKKNLEDKERDIYLAATYGNQLLSENEKLRKKQEELSACVETLKQEKYSFQLSIESKEAMIKTQILEIESLKENLESLSSFYEHVKKDQVSMSKKYEVLNKENADLKSSEEELLLKSNDLNKEVESLKKDILSYQDQMCQSLNETIYSEEFQKMQNDLSCLSKEKEDLNLSLLELQCQVNQMRNREVKFNKQIAELQEEVQDRDKEIATYSVLIQKSKEESDELRGEIELMKLEQLDVNRRGNSVFGELDDRRVAVERKYLELRDLYRNKEEQYMENLQKLRRTKNQLAAALASMGAQKVDAAYIEELENNLSCVKKENTELNRLLVEKERQNTSKSPDYRNIGLQQRDGYDYLRVLLQQSQEKIANLEDELSQVRRQKVIDNGKLIEAQNRLYHSEREAVMFRAEGLKLKLHIEELQNKENVICKPKEEMIPGFESKLDENKENNCINSDSKMPSKASQELCSEDAKLNSSASNFVNKAKDKIKIEDRTNKINADIISDPQCNQQ